MRRRDIIHYIALLAVSRRTLLRNELSGGMGHARPYDYPTYAAEPARNMRHNPSRSQHINAAPRHYPLYRAFGRFATNPSQKRIEWWDRACAALRLPYICCKNSTTHGGMHSPWSGVAIPRQQQPAPITFLAIWERVVLKTERGCGTGHAGT